MIDSTDMSCYHVACTSKSVYIKSEVAFAFCHLLGFRLLPRLKNISSQKLYRPEAGSHLEYEHLQPILTRPINWDLITSQYDEMIPFSRVPALPVSPNPLVSSYQWV